MKYIRETTDWQKCDYAQPQHIYMVESSGALAGYVKNGTTTPVWFNKPLRQWSQTRRKFVELTSAEIATIEGNNDE